jgi:uncharacterized protein YecT (DUF1311 family)
MNAGTLVEPSGMNSRRCSVARPRAVLECMPWLAALLLFGSYAHATGALKEEEAAALCARFADAKGMPAASAADKAEFADDKFCIDYLYELVDDERDPDKARRCCLAHGDCNRELGIVYANGWGTKRDYDAATYFLCRAGEEMAPFEQWGMLAHVQEMRGDDAPEDLTYCEHVTSGRGQFFCEQLAGNAAGIEENRKTEAVAKDFDEATKAAAAKLEAAANTFSQEQSGFEAYESRGGTAYPALALAAQNAAFSAHVERFVEWSRQRAPKADAAALARADAELNRVYKEARAKTEACPLCNEGDAGERDALRDAQRAWLAYRDAFADFYAGRWRDKAPGADLMREALAALTLARAAELAEFVKARTQ